MTRVVLALCLLGCGASSELDVPGPAVDASVHDVHPDAALDAGVDVAVPITFATTCTPPDAAPPTDICSRGVVMGPIFQPAGCIDDYFVDAGAVGELEVACDGGSDWAAVVFAGTTFPGSVHGTYVDVCIATTYPWEDGPNCQFRKSIWTTAQRIYGDYTAGNLTYTYGDKMIQGHSCWSPCFAWGSVGVE